MGNVKNAVIGNDCKSFGLKVAGFKKCEDCEVKVKEACQELFKTSFILAKKAKEDAAVVVAEVVEEVVVVEEVKSNKEGEVKMEKSNQAGTQASKVVNVSGSNAKIGKAELVKNAIFGLARKAEYTRKELGAAIKAAFPEYKDSTLSTYISDSFNVKYAGKTGCGNHRMLMYVKGGADGSKKIIVVR